MSLADLFFYTFLQLVLLLVKVLRFCVLNIFVENIFLCMIDVLYQCTCFSIKESLNLLEWSVFFILEKVDTQLCIIIVALP